MSGEVQHRKRKDKRKKRTDEGRQDDVLDQSEINEKNDDEHLLREDSEETNHRDHHHGPTAGVTAKIVFFILFSGLLLAMGTIFLQIKDTEIRDTPIKESRYAHILENFIEENAADEHEEHDLQHSDEHDEEHEEHEDHETDQPPSEPETQPEAADVILEPSMPEEIEIPELHMADEDEDEENEISDETIDEIEMEQVDEETVEVVQTLDPENIEEHPNEEIPQLAEQDAAEDERVEENDDDEEKGYLDTLFEGMFSHIETAEEIVETEDANEENDMEKDTSHETSETSDPLEDESQESVENMDDGREDYPHDEMQHEDYPPDGGSVEPDVKYDKSDENNNNDDNDNNVYNDVVEDALPDFDENMESQIEEPYLKSRYSDFGYEDPSGEVSKEETDEDDPVDEETRKEYIKIIDDVLREQQNQQLHQNQQKVDDRASYPHSAITNDYDFEIRKEIDEANKLIDKKKKSLGNQLLYSPILVLNLSGLLIFMCFLRI